MSDNRKGKESPTDFNECVSKDELTGLVTEQRTYMQEQFDALTRQLNGLVTGLNMLSNDLHQFT
jgi:hypothetical protein